MRKLILPLALLLVTAGGLLCSCRTDAFEPIIPSTATKVTEGVETDYIKGLFLLNEGNMGSNKASLDYFDYGTGCYDKNIFPERNPNIVKELGDVGNDIQIYEGKIYCVINASNLVEVMDVNTAKHITTISIPNCRYITFKDGFAYVSSYAGPIGIDPESRLGYVAKVNLADFSVVAECIVGYQPEEMVIVDDKLYVANSGGYRFPNYDSTLSIIDLNTFTESSKVEVATNLHRLESDNYGNIYISSRGDHKNIPSKTFIYDTKNGAISDKLNPLPNSNMAICGDSLYIYSYQRGINGTSYSIVNTKSQKVITTNFIQNGVDKEILIPYGIAVNPENREVFITNSPNYSTPGTLYCFDIDGVKKWSVETGDIPAHITFTESKLQSNYN